ncbi:GGDEF domain-containing protein [Rhizobium sp. SSA_523]|uniref:GGDEF domain-containing protein n=1 Tax=Rhizobium sp. SSA_523 TaxID=2952477 RepID=UPI00209005F6|nr:GGDEF domain-containing protein [Rhizobium sp. SSA_523]MCO5733930.1 GGDEF domain-containing protein [Rhizobium sp. SSA_523]WKC24807.1 GGDEF domain-containing protein [Rhizobium sp. SSA_523]
MLLGLASPFDDKHEAAIKPDLIDLLFRSTFTALYIGATGALFCGAIAVRTGDVTFWILATLSGVITLFRYAIDRAYHQARASRSLAFWEMSHAAGSVMFALLVSTIGVQVFFQGPPEASLFTAFFLVSYCSGVVTRLGVRPWLAIGCILIAVLPQVIALFFAQDLLNLMAGVFLGFTSLAGIKVIRTSYGQIVELLLARAKMAALAGSDALTGLANRLAADNFLQHLVGHRPPGGQTLVAVHFIDLVFFKAVNDGFGHEAGDAVLVEVGRRLTALMPARAMAARHGGDEFLVIQPQIASPLEAVQLAKRIVESLSRPYLAAGQSLRIGASVGIAVTKDSHRTAASLVASADDALYQAKRKGRGGIELHDLQIDRSQAEFG